MKTTHFLPLLTLLPFFAASCGESTEASQRKDTGAIPVKLLQLGNAAAPSATIAVSGQFTTDDEVLLSFKTGGIIQRLHVKEGDAVKQGQVLATLHMTEIDAQVQQAQLGYEKAERDYQRTQRLYGDSVATLEQLQNAQTALDMAREQLRSARFNRSHSQIRAPRNGYVLRRLASEGQVVQPGTPVFETNGASAGNWMLRAAVSNSEWAAIQLNDKALLEVEPLPGKTFAGVVCRKSEGVDPATGAFSVDIRFSGEKPAGLAFGMFGKAQVTPAAKATAAGTIRAIPYDALLDGDGSTGYVFVTSDGKTAQKVKVSIAGMEKEQVLISKGLENATAVIISGSAYLTDSSAIKVIP